MRRLTVSFVVLLLTFSAAVPLSADVRTDQRVKFQLGGAIGKLVNVFGGKAARDGVTSIVAVKGDRKATMSDASGQIIDLAEEKIYDLDFRRKTYTVTTFAELRKRMEEARREAEKSAGEARTEPTKPAERDPNAKEYEVDFDVKNTGDTKTINGFSTKRAVLTITVREKGKTLNDSGGMVITTDLWNTTGAPSTRELADFDLRYAQKLFGPVMTGASAQDMAAALALYPQLQPALEKMRVEAAKLEGTAILTDTRVETVPPGMANTTAAAPAAEPEQKKGRFGGLMGGLKKMAEAGNSGGGNSKPQRAVVMTTTVEMLKITTDVDAASVAMPAGFTERK